MFSYIYIIYIINAFFFKKKTNIKKRRMINNEFTVEDIVRERSLTVFKNKCRIFHISKEFEEFINKRR